jgi:Predicted membrane protein (DUF2207)
MVVAAAVLLAGAVVASAILVLAFAHARASRRVAPGIWPPLVGDEPPAIVNLLVNDFTLTRDAIAATLVDLAARGYLQIEEIGAGSFVCRLHGHAPRALTPYETQVYEAVRDACSNGSAPVETLTREIRRQPRSWRSSFERAVIKDAREREMIAPRWTAFSALLFVLALIGVAVGIAVIATDLASGSDEPPWIIPVAVGWVGVYVVTYVPEWLAERGRQRGRPAGRAAAARWLGVRRQLALDPTFPDLPPTATAVWERYLAYGVALGISHSASGALPLGDDDRPVAWSAATGGWRRVHIQYPRIFPPAWGRPPINALLAGLVTTAIGAWLLVMLWRPDPPHPSPPFSEGAANVVGDLEPLLWLITAVLLIWGVPVLVGALFDLGGTRAVTGQVILTRERLGPYVYPGLVRLPTRHYLVVDQGVGDRLRAYRVTRAQYQSVVERENVTLRVTPRLGHVVAIDQPAP